ncbi:MAG: hypothetical protein JNJ57_09360 [Saprospiraceae bacterium]|nr:hypothetical protein [Saprospiraceae bacterium]
MQPIKWWESLSDLWKKAFNEGVLCRGATTEIPTLEQLQQLLGLSVLRLAGPDAQYPNLSFELKDLSGIEQLKHLEILVVIHHQIRNLDELKLHKKLKSIFVFNNHIEQINGIENLNSVQELYCQNNYIDSLKPLSKLTQLQTLYCSGNQMESLDGVGPRQAASLKKFYCLPNAKLLNQEIFRFELEFGIRCERG